MKYIFIDTNLFIDVVTSNEGEEILNSIFKQLGKENVKFVLPEVIKSEILTLYGYWKDGVIENVRLSLATKKILGIEDLTGKGKDQNKQQKGETESEKIDGVIDSDRKAIIRKVERYYKSISKQIDKIFKHKNTTITVLTDQILLAGMKRSLLKKSPYTRRDPFVKSDKRENTNTTDIDCIAFEALVAFCKKHSGEHKKNTLVMCVSDKDYFSTDGDLHADLKRDIVIEHKCYKAIQEMLDKEFNAQVGSKKTKSTKKQEDAVGSLAGSDGGLAESSKIRAS